MFILFYNLGESFSQEQGTFIISIVKNDTIWIGADSKLSPAINPCDSVPPKCKILRFNDFVVAHAGIYSYKDFNIDSLLTFSFQKTPTFYGMMGEFINQLGTQLTMRSVQRNFHNSPKAGETVFSAIIIFSKFINDKPVIFKQSFNSYWVDTSKISLKTILDSIPQGTKIKSPANTVVHLDSVIIDGVKLPYVDYFGVTPFTTLLAKNFVSKGHTINQVIQAIPNIPKFIELIIKSEIKASPCVIGKPISIIRLAKDSIEWVPEYEGLCGEQKNE